LKRGRRYSSRRTLEVVKSHGDVGDGEELGGGGGRRVFVPDNGDKARFNKWL
jgi:hypothetical protein